MKKFKLFERKVLRNIIVDKEYVTEVLSIINSYGFDNYKYGYIGSCGWASEKIDRWYIHLITADKTWESIKSRISKLDTDIVVENNCYQRKVRIEVL